MSKVAYVPFSDTGLLGYVKRTVTSFNGGRIFDKFESSPRVHKSGALSGVGTGTQVYIFGHGAPKSDTISDNVGTSLTMDELAQQLKDAGLKGGHKVIKLNACNGGTGGLQSMACKLMVAMRGAGFPAVSVYGYTENLKVTAKDGSKHGSSGARAKDIRVKFK